MVSVLSFLGLAQGVDGLHAAIGRVVVADLVALGALGIGAAAWAIAGRTAARRAVDRS
jgi:hypothetical protein